MRKTILPLLALILTSAPAAAQSTSWLDKAFQRQITHDFGNVPHGAQLHFRFPMTNIWAVPLEITQVRVSCGCVTAKPSAQSLQPRDSGYIDITMDAHRFVGPKTVTIYVSVGPQYIATTALQVSANCRRDIVFNPGEINFGVVQRGHTVEKTIEVEYAGALDWRISEAEKGSLPLELSLQQLYRQPGRVGYRLKATLQADAPAGLLKQEVILKTNDPTSPLVPVLVQAVVQAPLTVSPARNKLGTIKVGETVTRRINMIGEKPFRVTAIEGLDKEIKADLPTAAATIQTITFTIHLTKAGPLERKFTIKTDLAGQAPVTVTIEGTATANAAEPDLSN